MKIERDRSVPLEPITCAATVQRYELLLETEQQLQPSGLHCILAHAHLLELQLADLLLQGAIFRPHPAQVKVVMPQVRTPPVVATKPFSSGVTAPTVHTRIRRVDSLSVLRFTCTPNPTTSAKRTATRMVRLR